MSDTVAPAHPAAGEGDNAATVDDDAPAGRPPGRYALSQQQLHWVVAAAVVLQLLLGLWVGTTPPARHGAILVLHAVIGTTIFALMVSRLRLRRRLGAPPPPAGTPLDAAVFARANHLGYYALLLVLPVIGWCALLSRGAIGAAFGRVHLALALVLVLAICAHLAGVAYHGLIRRDGLLRRMTLS